MRRLVDPNNPALWADGTRRSQSNAFTVGFGGDPIDWTPEKRGAKRRELASDAVERRRQAGESVGTIAMMGRTQGAISIENAEVGRRSAEKRARLSKGRLI